MPKVQSNDTDALLSLLRVFAWFSRALVKRRAARHTGRTRLRGWNVHHESDPSYARPNVLCGVDFFRHQSHKIEGTLRAPLGNPEQEPVSLLKACVSEEEFEPALEVRSTRRAN